jgi:hypothetical protein
MQKIDGVSGMKKKALLFAVFPPCSRRREQDASVLLVAVKSDTSF